MTNYLIAFNDEWVPHLTVEQMRERGTSGRALIEEMKDAGVFLFGDGGLDGSTVVDVPDDAQARYWAGRMAVAVGWPQEVHRFPDPERFQNDTRS
jgi:hypothetical protein